MVVSLLTSAAILDFLPLHRRCRRRSCGARPASPGMLSDASWIFPRFGHSSVSWDHHHPLPLLGSRVNRCLLGRGQVWDASDRDGMDSEFFCLFSPSGRFTTLRTCCGDRTCLFRLRFRGPRGTVKLFQRSPFDLCRSRKSLTSDSGETLSVREENFVSPFFRWRFCAFPFPRCSGDFSWYL